MATKEVAQGLVNLCKQGQFEAAMSEYYSDDIVSVEPHGDSPESRGIEAVKAKAEWWNNNFEVHGAVINGPYVCGDQFVVRFEIDVTDKGSGKRSTLEEVGVYTAKNDKVVHERFYTLEA